MQSVQLQNFTHFLYLHIYTGSQVSQADINHVHSASTVVFMHDSSNTNINNNNFHVPAIAAPPSASTDKEAAAATKIQAHYRGYIVRKEKKNTGSSNLNAPNQSSHLSQSEVPSGNRNRYLSNTDSVFLYRDDEERLERVHSETRVSDAGHHKQLLTQLTSKSLGATAFPQDSTEPAIGVLNKETDQVAETSPQPQDETNIDHQTSQEDKTSETEEGKPPQPEGDTNEPPSSEENKVEEVQPDNTSVQEEPPCEEPDQVQSEPDGNQQDKALPEIQATDSISQLTKLIVSSAIEAAVARVTAENDTPETNADQEETKPSPEESAPSTLEEHQEGEKNTEKSDTNVSESVESTNKEDGESVEAVQNVKDQPESPEENPLSKDNPTED